MHTFGKLGLKFFTGRRSGICVNAAAVYSCHNTMPLQNLKWTLSKSEKGIFSRFVNLHMLRNWMANIEMAVRFLWWWWWCEWANTLSAVLLRAVCVCTTSTICIWFASDKELYVHIFAICIHSVSAALLVIYVFSIGFGSAAKFQLFPNYLSKYPIVVNRSKPN